MKKQSAMFLSFSALLTIGAISPHVLWHADKFSSRSPSSVEQEKINSEELKPLEKVEAAIESREVKLVQVDAQVSCLKDTQPKELEAEVKKLMEDKEKIMKELEELKASKEKKEDKEDKDDKKDVKKVAKTDYNEDILGIMSQLTSLMVSQQQQSMMMMTQMFSMFQAQQPKQQSYYSPMSDYMSPYAFNASQFEFPNQKSIYSLEGMGHDVGLRYGFQSKPFHEYDYSRVPAQQSDFGPMFERSQFDSTGSFQPQQLEVRPHDGFNFNHGLSSMGLDRMNF